MIEDPKNKDDSEDYKNIIFTYLMLTYQTKKEFINLTYENNHTYKAVISEQHPLQSQQIDELKRDLILYSSIKEYNNEYLEASIPETADVLIHFILKSQFDMLDIFSRFITNKKFPIIQYQNHFKFLSGFTPSSFEKTSGIIVYMKNKESTKAEKEYTKIYIYAYEHPVYVLKVINDGNSDFISEQSFIKNIFQSIFGTQEDFFIPNPEIEPYRTSSVTIDERRKIYEEEEQEIQQQLQQEQDQEQEEESVPKKDSFVEDLFNSPSFSDKSIDSEVFNGYEIPFRILSLTYHSIGRYYMRLYRWLTDASGFPNFDALRFVLMYSVDTLDSKFKFTFREDKQNVLSIRESSKPFNVRENTLYIQDFYGNFACSAGFIDIKEPIRGPRKNFRTVLTRHFLNPNEETPTKFVEIKVRRVNSQMDLLRYMNVLNGVFQELSSRISEYKESIGDIYGALIRKKKREVKRKKEDIDMNMLDDVFEGYKRVCQKKYQPESDRLLQDDEQKQIGEFKLGDRHRIPFPIPPYIKDGVPYQNMIDCGNKFINPKQNTGNDRLEYTFCCKTKYDKNKNEFIKNYLETGQFDSSKFGDDKKDKKVLQSSSEFTMLDSKMEGECPKAILRILNITDSSFFRVGIANTQNEATILKCLEVAGVAKINGEVPDSYKNNYQYLEEKFKINIFIFSNSPEVTRDPRNVLLVDTQLGIAYQPPYFKYIILLHNYGRESKSGEDRYELVCRRENRVVSYTFGRLSMYYLLKYMYPSIYIVRLEDVIGQSPMDDFGNGNQFLKIRHNGGDFVIFASSKIPLYGTDDFNPESSIFDINEAQTRFNSYIQKYIGDEKYGISILDRNGFMTKDGTSYYLYLGKEYDIVSSSNRYERNAQLLMESAKYVFSKKYNDKQGNKNITSYLNEEFSEDGVEIKNDFPEPTDINTFQYINMGKLVVPSNVLLERVIFFLRREISLNGDSILNYYKRETPRIFPLEKTEGTRSNSSEKNEKIVHSYDCMEKIIQSSKSPNIIYSEVDPDYKEPYYYMKDGNVFLSWGNKLERLGDFGDY
jgi:hypothetical protein